MAERQLEFVTYVIGILAERLNLSAAKIYALLSSANIISDYIVPGYDILHTYGKDYLVDEIIDVMKEKGVYQC